MQLTVTLTPQEQRKIAGIINRPADAPLNFWRFVVLAVALAPPVYTFVTYIGDVPTPTILNAIFTYPLLYVGVVLYLLLSKPVLRLLGYDDAKRVGGRVLNGEEQTYAFDAASFTRSQKGQVVSAYTFSAVGEVRRKKGFMLILQQNILLAALPERCFASREDAAAMDNTLRNSVAYSRGGFAQPLAADFADCIWRFQYLVDAGLGLAANTLVRASKPGKRFVRKAGWVVFMVLMVLVLIGITALFVLSDTGYGTPYFLIYLIWLPAFGVLAARNPGKLSASQILPGYTYGATTMEVRADGVRVWGPQYEELYTWRDLTGVLQGNGFGLVMRRAVVAAALPYNVAPPDVVQAAMEHIARNTGAAKVAPVPVAPEPPAEPTL